MVRTSPSCRTAGSLAREPKPTQSSISCQIWIVFVSFPTTTAALSLTRSAAAVPITYYVLNACSFYWKVVFRPGSAVDKNVPGPPKRILTGNIHQVSFKFSSSQHSLNIHFTVKCHREDLPQVLLW